MQEAEFAHDVRQDVYEERQNQLRWQIRLGEVQISSKKRTYVLEDRMHAWEDYRVCTFKIYFNYAHLIVLKILLPLYDFKKSFIFKYFFDLKFT